MNNLEINEKLINNINKLSECYINACKVENKNIKNIKIK